MKKSDIVIGEVYTLDGENVLVTGREGNQFVVESDWGEEVVSAAELTTELTPDERQYANDHAFDNCPPY